MKTLSVNCKKRKENKMKNLETVGVVRERERERVYLNKIINFFGNEKRMDFYKKTERRNQFFKCVHYISLHHFNKIKDLESLKNKHFQV